MFPCIGAIYLRFTNIRDASRALRDTVAKSKDWRIEGVSAQEINKVTLLPSASGAIYADAECQATGISVLASENEGLHNIVVYPGAHLNEAQIQDRIREHFKHYDIFAMAKQPTSLLPDTVRWIIEWSDVNGTWACAHHLYNCGWVDVSLYDPVQRLTKRG